MIEAQGDFRLRFRDELMVRFVPRWNFFSRAEAKQQRLIGQRNRRAPFYSECSEIRNRSDAAGLHIGGNAPLSRQLDQFFILRLEIGQRSFVRAADYWYHDSILRFHRDADVDRSGLNKAVADKYGTGAWIFCESKRQRAHGVKARSGFRIARSTILQNWVESYCRYDR